MSFSQEANSSLAPSVTTESEASCSRKKNKKSGLAMIPEVSVQVLIWNGLVSIIRISTRTFQIVPKRARPPFTPLLLPSPLPYLLPSHIIILIKVYP